MFVILDGVADEPCRVLNDKTPLDYAKTPNLDWISSRSKIGHCFPIAEGVAPQSSSGIVSLFGEDYKKASRGTLEAVGTGITLKDGDLALRCNFATIDNLKDLNLIDRRAGRTLTTREAKLLADAVNKHVKLPYSFELVPTIGHRAVLVFRGVFSDKFSNVDPAYEDGVSIVSDNKIKWASQYEDSSASKLSANLVNSFIQKSFVVLSNHEINLKRQKKGFFPANFLLCRDPGNKNISFKKLVGNWAGFCYMPLEIGLGLSFNMAVKSFAYPELKDIDSYASLSYALNLAIKNSTEFITKFSKSHDYLYIHFKETDLPGHDNKPFEKVKLIEMLDKNFFSFLKEFINKTPCKILVTSDHTTSCRAKNHTAHPVPVLYYDSSKPTGMTHRFTEKDASIGKVYSGLRILKETLF